MPTLLLLASTIIVQYKPGRACLRYAAAILLDRAWTAWAFNSGRLVCQAKKVRSAELTISGAPRFGDLHEGTRRQLVRYRIISGQQISILPLLTASSRVRKCLISLHPKGSGVARPTRPPQWRSVQPSRTPGAREKPWQPRPQGTEPPGSAEGSCRALCVSCLAPCKKKAQPRIAGRKRPRGKILAGVKSFRDVAHRSSTKI
jgi:hypothetical protein